MAGYEQPINARFDRLDDPVVAASEIDIQPIGKHTVAEAIEPYWKG